MKKLCAVLVLATLAGCGVETATTAAASAEIDHGTHYANG